MSVVIVHKYKCRQKGGGTGGPFFSRNILLIQALGIHSEPVLRPPGGHTSKLEAPFRSILLRHREALHDHLAPPKHDWKTLLVVSQTSKGGMGVQ